MVASLSRVCQAAVSKPEGSENGSYINLFPSLSLSFSLCDSNEKACPGNSLSRKYTEAGEGEMHVGGWGGIISLRRKNESERGKRAVSGLQKIKS